MKSDQINSIDQRLKAAQAYADKMPRAARERVAYIEKIKATRRLLKPIPNKWLNPFFYIYIACAVWSGLMAASVLFLAFGIIGLGLSGSPEYSGDADWTFLKYIFSFYFFGFIAHLIGKFLHPFFQMKKSG